MKILKTILVILLHSFLISNAAQATIIDNGNYTTDTGSGLDWLDVTLTIDRSYNDISSQLGIGGEFEGWRYAHSEDVRTLIQNHTGTTLFTKNPYVKTIQFDTEILDDLAHSLGITRTGLGPRGSTAHWVHGLTSDFDARLNSHAYQFIVTTTPQIFPSGNVILNWQSLFDDKSSTTVGSHLIRGTVSPVPIPATIWLMGTGMIGLIGFSRKKIKKKPNSFYRIPTLFRGNTHSPQIVNASYKKIEIPMILYIHTNFLHVKNVVSEF